jgi:hypothetical protein
LVNNPSSIEIDILTSAVVKAQSNYPNLKIHISAPTAMYEQEIKASYTVAITPNN